jgi:hypothetical protein
MGGNSAGFCCLIFVSEVSLPASCSRNQIGTLENSGVSTLQKLFLHKNMIYGTLPPFGDRLANLEQVATHTRVQSALSTFDIGFICVGRHQSLHLLQYCSEIIGAKRSILMSFLADFATVEAREQQAGRITSSSDGGAIQAGDITHAAQQADGIEHSITAATH